MSKTIKTEIVPKSAIEELKLFVKPVIVFAVGIVRTYFSPEKTRKILGGKKLFIGNSSNT